MSNFVGNVHVRLKFLPRKYDQILSQMSWIIRKLKTDPFTGKFCHR